MNRWSNRNPIYVVYPRWTQPKTRHQASTNSVESILVGIIIKSEARPNLKKCIMHRACIHCDLLYSGFIKQINGNDQKPIQSNSTSCPDTKRERKAKKKRRNKSIQCKQKSKRTALSQQMISSPSVTKHTKRRRQTESSTNSDT